MHIPANFKKTYSKSQIEEKISAIASELTPWMQEVYDTTHKPVIIAPVMKGGMFFSVDLMRHLDVPFELAYAVAHAYYPNESGVPLKKVTVNTSQVNAFGRSIILVDEICDSGKTLNSLSADLISNGARQIKTATLIFRKPKGTGFIPNHFGFLHEGDEWFVGYGMHEKQLYRQLTDIYTINPDGTKHYEKD